MCTCALPHCSCQKLIDWIQAWSKDACETFASLAAGVFSYLATHRQRGCWSLVLIGPRGRLMGIRVTQGSGRRSTNLQLTCFKSECADTSRVFQCQARN